MSASLGCVAALSKRQFESRSGSACDMQCGEILDFDTWCGWGPGRVGMDLFKNSFSHEIVKWEDGGVMGERA